MQIITKVYIFFLLCAILFGVQIASARAESDYSNSTIQATKWFNSQTLSTSTTKGIMMNYLLFALVVSCFIFAVVINVPAMDVLAFFIGIAYSIYIFTIISAVIGGLSALLCLGYLLASLSKK